MQYLFNYPTLVYPDFDYPVRKNCEKNMKNLYEKNFFGIFDIILGAFFLLFFEKDNFILANIGAPFVPLLI